MSYSQPLVVALDSSLENESEKVAKQLGLHFMGNLKEIQKQYKTNNVNLNNCYFFVVGKNKFYLKLGLREINKPIYCNFLKWSKDTKKTNLIKSMRGVSKDCLVVDATAGLGQDSLKLASLSGKIILLEKVPWIHALLKQGLNEPENQNSLVSRMEAICVESKHYLSSLKKKVDVIYLDTMFPNVSKSKAKKEIQALRELTETEEDFHLLNISLKVARERVIVKRHKNSNFLAGRKPTFSIKGQVVRYDVYSVTFS